MSTLTYISGVSFTYFILKYFWYDLQPSENRYVDNENRKICSRKEHHPPGNHNRDIPFSNWHFRHNENRWCCRIGGIRNATRNLAQFHQTEWEILQDVLRVWSLRKVLTIYPLWLL